MAGGAGHGRARGGPRVPDLEVALQPRPCEQYRKAVEAVWADNKVSAAEADELDALAIDLGLSADTISGIEHRVIGDTKEVILERQERAAREQERKAWLDQLYGRARRLHHNEEWQAVVDIFAQIHLEDPNYPDPEGLFDSARENLEAREVARRVAAFYDEGQQHMDAREWRQAFECFQKVQQLEPGYRDSKELVTQVQFELAKRKKQASRVQHDHAPETQLIAEATDEEGNTIQRTVDESGDIIKTIFDGSGNLLDEDLVGNVADLPVEDEYHDEEGQTIRAIRDASGSLIYLVLDPDGSILDVTIFKP